MPNHMNQPVDGISEDNAQIMKDCPQNGQLAEKWSFEGNRPFLLLHK